MFGGGRPLKRKFWSQSEPPLGDAAMWISTFTKSDEYPFAMQRLECNVKFTTTPVN